MRRLFASFGARTPRAAQRWCSEPPDLHPQGGRPLLPADVGSSLVGEISDAKLMVSKRKRVAGRKQGRKLSTKEKQQVVRLLQVKRMRLIELGKKIPASLLGRRQRAAQKILDKLDRSSPGSVNLLKRYARERPERRQLLARNDWCTSINSSAIHVHPYAQERYFDILQSSPRGLLRHHLREVVPVLDDRMKERHFHQFYDSTDRDILQRQGLVFEGRDGEPLALNHEELRMLKESELYKRIDPRMKSRMRWQVNRRLELRSKRLPVTPTFRPMVYTQGDSLAYFGYRMYPVYSVMYRIFSEIANRVPQFMPRGMLDFGAGWGTSMLCAQEVWKGIGKTKRVRNKQQTLRWEMVANPAVKAPRLYLSHPRIRDAALKEVLQAVSEGEVARLAERAADTKELVQQGKLPSGSEVEAEDLARDAAKMTSDEVWAGIEKWRGDEYGTSDEIGEDMLGPGTYSGATKPFSTTDYFLEGKPEDYPMPKEAQEMIDKGLSPKHYLLYRDPDEPPPKWAADYHKHLEKNKMIRDPTYKPFAAQQYLQATAVGWRSADADLESTKLHQDDAQEEEGALVYKDWARREKTLLGEYTAVEPSTSMMRLGQDFLGDVVPNVKWQRFLPEAPKDADSRTDLVVAAYTLSEFKSEKLRTDAIRSLWEHCSGVLIVVEVGTPAGFKLVLDARRTILEEYSGLGPWESQPTVLAPCPHDNLRCPVEYGLLGRRFPQMRTCYSASDYYPSFVEKWVRESIRGRDTACCEQYSYVVIARNDVAPRKATRQVPRSEPTTITADPAKMETDERLQSLLNDPEEFKEWLPYETRRKVAADQRCPPDPPIPVPETEQNLRPFFGRLYEYGRPLELPELLAVKAEVAGYEKVFRDRMWEWCRLVRNSVLGRSSRTLLLDVCTPQGTLDRMQFAPSQGLRGGFRLAKDARAGALIPSVHPAARSEFVLSDRPNTFSQRVDSLNPLLINHIKKGRALREEQSRRMEYSEEEIAMLNEHEARLERARSGSPQDREAIRQEVLARMRGEG
eukprot:TRINITY_DN28715_c0_g1_i1.p1 TRINITY_DN28715_c0_g1~~TRINITY_DN28715_c0_g1_i1.p1  ORF type:complete len:1024 (+),score=338.39 TRINITY_DN28715_c0_g1_i1:79-3150(+)